MKVPSYRKLAAELTKRGYPLTEHAVRWAVRRGRIKRGKDEQFNVERCLKLLRETTSEALRAHGQKARKGNPPDSGKSVAKKPGGGDNGAAPAQESRADAERRKEIAWANLRELELAQKRGELVELATINAYVAGMIIRAREILTRIPGEMKDRLAREADPVKIEAVIDKEVRRVLGQLAEYKQ